jgi:hypothetical protein
VNRRRFIGWVGAVALLAVPRLIAAVPADDFAEVAREAIRRQRMLRIVYGGHVRLVEPHALGTSPGGHRALLAWQVSGGSRSNPPTGWRTFVLGEVRELSITVRGFVPRPSYRRDDTPLRSTEFDISSPDNPESGRSASVTNGVF